MKKIMISALSICLLACSLLTSCGEKEGMQDGYYTAELSEYHFGWKEFVTICVMEDKIVSVEYNAKNPSGFIKSWDIAYMRNMNSVQGTYPNKYTRTYGAQLLEEQNADHLDAVSGASSSGKNFNKLAAAVLEKAKKGDTSIAIVEVESEGE
ncbi:MAG: FMN-binding protein [Lachnospiraceae bacterium]|nr:FMN-binding protein [Lachnospiraceae bacterium]